MGWSGRSEYFSRGGIGFDAGPTDVKGSTMTFSTLHSAPGRLDRPDDETIRRERLLQDEEVVELRRMLAAMPGTNDEMSVYIAA